MGITVVRPELAAGKYLENKSSMREGPKIVKKIFKRTLFQIPFPLIVGSDKPCKRQDAEWKINGIKSVLVKARRKKV